MSLSTIAAGDHDDASFAEIVEHYDDPKPVRRPSRSCAEREAINEALGIRRRRSRERGL